ncbi:MAG: restriction endonuclease subunit S [Clostridia bacterium]
MKLKNVVEIKRGSSPRPINDYLSNCGYKWLKISDFNLGDKFINETKQFIKESGLKGTRLVKKGTLILTNSATPGIPIFIEDDMCLHDGFLYFKNLSDNMLNMEYLYCWLLNNQGNILNLANGSVFKNLKKEIVENLDIELPKIENQNKIVKVYDAINYKIIENTATNNNLYEITKQLYNRWFVDFEFPNEKGNSYKSDGGKMIESELGKIPENWIVKRLDDISINFDFKRKPLSSREREEKKGGIPYYGATSIIDYVDDYLFDDIYVLMGEDGTVINTDNTPVLQYIWRKCWVNNHTHILQGKSITTEHLMECLRSTDVYSIITGAVQLKINQANMNSLKYAIASDDINQKFEKILSSIYAKIRENIEKNENLINLRDTLLPKLMNGEIDLDNIEL